MIINSKSSEDTVKEGEKYASRINPGDVLGLDGELGTGKTRFVKGICNYFKVREVVNSPTFIIVNEYSGFWIDGSEIKIYHFDLYRLKTPGELGTIGFDEYINGRSIVIIEWPKMAEEYLGKSLKKVKFSHGNEENERKIELN
jgi:tRNA threonylcarbamoyladenosine biosynthesis protein TsaE